MTFLQFLGYFVASEIIFQTTVVLGVMAYRRLTCSPFEQALKSGQIRMLSSEEFEEMMAQKDKKSWN